MKPLRIIFFANMLVALPTFAQVEMTIVPMNKAIHIAEPISYNIKVRNASKDNIQGRFILNGFDPSFRILCGKVGSATTLFFNEAMWSAEHDGGNGGGLLTLAPGQELTERHNIHFDAKFQKLVFATPGEFVVGFNLAWNRTPDGGVVSNSTLAVTAKVTVVPWDPEKDKRQIEALAIWDNAEVATFVQNMGKKSPEADARLQRLKNEFGDTLYGGLAVAALQAENELEKRNEMKLETLRLLDEKQK